MDLKDYATPNRSRRPAFKSWRYAQCRYCKRVARVAVSAKPELRLRRRSCPTCGVDPKKVGNPVLRAISKAERLALARRAKAEAELRN